MRGFLSDTLGNYVSGKPHTTEEADKKKGQQVLLADKIDELGFGAYQFQVWILSSGFIIAEGAEVQMAAGLVNAMRIEFDVTTHLGTAMLMTWTFIGFGVGTFVSGPLGDNFGRRFPMLLGYMGVVFTAALTISLPLTQNLLYTLRFVLGFFAGIGIPNACISISEVMPTMLRGRATASLGIAYVIGEMWAALGLMVLMPDLVNGSWRLLVVWAAVPAICLLMFATVSPAIHYDTPFFLGCKGRTKELHKLLNLVADMNDVPHLKLGKEDFVVCQVPKPISLSDALPTLCRPDLIICFLVTCYMMFSKDFAYFGTDVFWPQIWANVASHFTPAQSLMCTASLGIPGVFMAAILMKHFPRILCVSVCATLCSICVVLLRGLEDTPQSLSAFVGVAVFKLLFPTWQMTTMLLPSELFGTQIRSWAFSLAACFGRIACILSPLAVELGTNGFTGILATLGLGVALLVHMLPETKDCELVEDAIHATYKKHLVEDGFESKVSYGAASAAKV